MLQQETLRNKTSESIKTSKKTKKNSRNFMKDEGSTVAKNVAFLRT